jgi:hypothetical protein
MKNLILIFYSLLEIVIGTELNTKRIHKLENYVNQENDILNDLNMEINNKLNHLTQIKIKINSYKSLGENYDKNKLCLLENSSAKNWSLLSDIKFRSHNEKNSVTSKENFECISKKSSSKQINDQIIFESPFIIKNKSFSYSNCFSILDILQIDKSIKFLKLINIPKDIYSIHNEKLLKINIQQIIFNSNFSIEESLLLILFTNQSLSLVDLSGNLLSHHNFNYNFNILQYDLTFLEEDNSLIFISDINELSSLTLSLKNYEKYTFNLTSRTSIGIPQGKIVFFQQLKLYGNYYIILSYQNGTIYVISKDLEIKSIINLEKSIDNIFLTTGIIGIVSGNEAIFLNVLGGNAVLLQCLTFSNILKAVYDSSNNFLFIIDEDMQLLVYNVKLSIAKYINNECSFLYKFKLPKIFEYESLKINMEINKNILLITIENRYILILDLNLNEKGLIFNEFLLLEEKEFLEGYTSFDLHLNSLISIKITNINSNKNFIFLNLNINNFALLQVSNFKNSRGTENIIHSKQNNYLSGNKNLTSFKNAKNSEDEKNWNFIKKGQSKKSLLDNVIKILNDNIFYVYLLVIITLSALIIYLKRKKLKEENIIKDYSKKKFSEENEKVLNEMWKKVNSISQNLKNEKQKEQTVSECEKSDYEGSDNISEKSYSDQQIINSFLNRESKKNR